MATARGVRFAEAHSSFRDEGAAGSDAVVKEFREALARAPEMAVAVAAIKVRERDCSIDATSGGPLSRPRPPHSTQLNPTQLQGAYSIVRALFAFALDIESLRGYSAYARWKEQEENLDDRKGRRGGRSSNITHTTCR